MADALRDVENQSVQILARLYGRGEEMLQDVFATLKAEGLDADGTQMRVAINVLKDQGLLSNLTYFGEHAACCTIAPTVIGKSRALLKAEEPGDIVEQIKQKAKGNPALAWIIILFFVLVALLTAINQVIQLLQTFGLMHKHG